MDFNKVLSWIPGWLGFLALIVVGTLMVLNGAINPAGADHPNVVGFIVFGICAVAIGAFSWAVGATSKIKGREGKVGVRVGVQDMPWWAWLVDIGVLVTCIVLFLILGR